MRIDPRAPETREFVSLLTRYQGELQSFIGSLMPGHSDSADVLQETNLTLWEKMGDFEPGSNFRAWAFAIARFKVLGYLKKLKDARLIHFDDLLIERLSHAAVEREPTRQESKAAALAHCLEELKPEDRELLEARYRSGLTVEKYAAEVERPATSLYVALGRIRVALRRCIDFRLWKEEQLG